MLVTLSIQNFAIIDAVEINFAQGMTVLSGETGAGKSIIIDALGLLCGGRGSTGFIREGSDRLMIEGLFAFDQEMPALAQVLAERGIEADLTQDQLVLSREIHQSGTNIIRINGQLANVSTLKAIGGYLSEIHGQNEHQALLDPSQHLTLLDSFGDGDYQRQLAHYQDAYAHYRAIRQEWLSANQTETDQRQRLNFIEFQAQEIEQYDLSAGEDEALQAQSNKMQQQAQWSESLAMINDLMGGNETSVLSQLDRTQTLLEQLTQLDDRLVPLVSRFQEARYELEDIAQQIAYSDASVEFDQSLDEIEGRLAELSQLKRRYGMSIEELLAYYDAISEEIYQLTHREHYLRDLHAQLQQAYSQALQLAEQLQLDRQAVATQLETAIETELADLYMENSRFKVEFSAVGTDPMLTESTQESYLQLTSTGIDRVEFAVATNLGESLKPLVKVASGGELSRFMLALKVIFSQNQAPKTMVFDEIDTGVSGRVAHAIAQKIREVANHHQVLCITHLPQVAAIAQTQLYITKGVVDGRTISLVETLDRPARQAVIAKMIAGEETTPAANALAEDLLNELERN